jgi:hypothetical protein
VLLTLTDFLDSLTHVWDSVDTFLIEKQMTTNPKAMRLGHHVQSYFLTIYRDFKTIIEFPSQHKTRVLGCPKELRRKKKDRKKFCVEQATDIMRNHGGDMMDKYFKLKKKDDISDCICQAKAFVILQS